MNTIENIQHVYISRRKATMFRVYQGGTLVFSGHCMGWTNDESKMIRAWLNKAE